MKMFNFKKLLSFFIVLILSCGVLCFAGCKTETISTNSADLKSSNFELSSMHENGISLTRKKAIVIKDNNGNYLQETLTANIMADVGNDKTLVWSAKWVDSSVTANLSEYLKVEPLQAGGNVANVKCYKNFEEFGSIVITASSKVAPNVMASCMVNYVGKPTDIELLDENNSAVDVIRLYSNSSYSFTVNQKHPLDVGSFYEDFEISFYVTGEVLLEGITMFDDLAVLTDTILLDLDTYNKFVDFEEAYKANPALFDEIYGAAEYLRIEKIFNPDFYSESYSFQYMNCSSFYDISSYLDYYVSDDGQIVFETKDYFNVKSSCRIYQYEQDVSIYFGFKVLDCDTLDIVMTITNKNSGLSKQYLLILM